MSKESVRAELLDQLTKSEDRLWYLKSEAIYSPYFRIRPLTKFDTERLNAMKDEMSTQRNLIANIKSVLTLLGNTTEKD
jgi:hypothetical protein